MHPHLIFPFQTSLKCCLTGIAVAFLLMGCASPPAPTAQDPEPSTTVQSEPAPDEPPALPANPIGDAPPEDVAASLDPPPVEPADEEPLVPEPPALGLDQPVNLREFERVTSPI